MSDEILFENEKFNISTLNYYDDDGDIVDIVDGGNVSKRRNNDKMYGMDHGRRGLALLFNHFRFERHLDLVDRAGTEVDKEIMKSTFSTLGFDVQTYDNLTYQKLMETLEEAANLDHADADCIVIAILSHGENDILYSKDRAYKLEEILEKFNEKNCKTLAGKPKLFFIQADLETRIGNGSEDLQIPEVKSLEQEFSLVQDFLIFQSLIPGAYFRRNNRTGSLFVQELCKILTIQGRSTDLVSNLKKVSKLVSTGLQSTMTQHILADKFLCLKSNLLKDVYFRPKPLPTFDWI